MAMEADLSEGVYLKVGIEPGKAAALEAQF
jgi:hypothetical protein